MVGVGVAVAAVVLLGLAAGLIYFFVGRKRRRRPPPSHQGYPGTYARAYNAVAPVFLGTRAIINERALFDEAMFRRGHVDGCEYATMRVATPDAGPAPALAL